MKDDGGYEVREHRKDDVVSASTLPIGGSDIWKRGYLSLFVRPMVPFCRHVRRGCSAKFYQIGQWFKSYEASSAKNHHLYICRREDGSGILDKNAVG